MIVGVGANSVDFVCTVPAAPSATGAASKMRLTHHRLSCGGQVATSLSACARFGLRTRYIGAFGNDANGARIRAALSAQNVDLTHTRIRETANRFAVIIIDDSSGERIVLWDRNEHLNLTDSEVTSDAIAGARVVHVDDEDVRASVRAGTIARSFGIDVTTDIDRAVDGVDEIIELATHPIFSEHIGAELTGESDPERALRKLRKRHAGVLTITLGAQGAVALGAKGPDDPDGDTLIHAPGFPVKAVDTTGAGDIFRAGFIYGLVEGWSLEKLLRFANAAAAASCMKPGAMDSSPELAEVFLTLGKAEER